MKFIVGGQTYELDRDRVERTMKKVHPESIQKYRVELLGIEYPPKQVFSKITGRNRRSFTSQEALRVLTKLGFACREVGQQIESTPARLPIQVYEPTASAPVDRLVAVENGLATVHLAIAELQRRIEVLEAN